MQIDLWDHSYKDVAHTPIRDMVSTTGCKDKESSRLEWQKPVWLCNIDDEEGSNVVVSNDYIPEPFPKNLLEPLGWYDVLDIVDVCANVHATKHHGDEGYDIMSCNMVSIIHALEGE